MEYNVYCDESCHLEHDRINVMALGGIWCKKNRMQQISSDIRGIKQKYGVSATAETKWTKIGPTKKQLYIDLINYFFDCDDLFFRCLLVPDKSKLSHEKYHQTHNEWYYKMYYEMLKILFHKQNIYNVYLDYKDTHSYYRCKELHNILCSAAHDDSRTMINKVQPIKSDEVQIMQLVDILIGAIAYENRIFPDDHEKSLTKLSIVDLIRTRSGCDLHTKTGYRQKKFNLFIWEPDYESGGAK